MQEIAKDYIIFNKGQSSQDPSILHMHIDTHNHVLKLNTQIIRYDTHTHKLLPRLNRSKHVISATKPLQWPQQQVAQNEHL